MKLRQLQLTCLVVILVTAAAAAKTRKNKFGQSETFTKAVQESCKFLKFLKLFKAAESYALTSPG